MNCTLCGERVRGRNHCPFCGQPDYDEMSGLRDRVKEARLRAEYTRSLRFFEPSYVNATIQSFSFSRSNILIKPGDVE